MAHRTLLPATTLAAAVALLSEAGHPAAAQSGARSGVHPTPEQLTTIPRSAVVYYKDKCLVCHGVTGEGDGEGSKELDPKPRSFAEPEWQQSVSDQKIRDATVKGGPAVGLSEAMPAYPDLANQKEKVDGLVGLIRAFGTVKKQGKGR